MGKHTLETKKKEQNPPPPLVFYSHCSSFKHRKKYNCFKLNFQNCYVLAYSCLLTLQFDQSIYLAICLTSVAEIQYLTDLKSETVRCIWESTVQHKIPVHLLYT